MDIQTRKINFIQEFLKHADTEILDKFEAILNQKRKVEFEKELKPMTLVEYEQRINKAIGEVRDLKVKSAASLKKEIQTWK